jgi:ribulose-5-phosphate 4-epimerase/fuculose-1-phosphate aldolase
MARALHREGYDDHHFGHITVERLDGTFLTLPRELAWDEPRAGDVLHIDRDGQLLSGSWTVPPSIELHLAFHRSNPGTGVLIHHHPRYATIWSALGRVPPAYDQTSAFIADDEIAVGGDYAGNVSAPDAAEISVRAMGDRRVALLAHHGVLVRGPDIPRTHALALAIEWRCRRAWEVESVGAGPPMAAEGHDRIVTAIEEECDGRPPFLWEWAVRQELRRDPSVIDDVDVPEREPTT